jgi:hypothetical protein
MRILRVGLHSVVLAVGCLVSILVGFGLYNLLRNNWAVDQLVIQAPAAVLVLILGFSVWYMLINRSPLPGIRLGGVGELVAVYILSLCITPLIFLPLHYLTQGYISSMDNLLSILYFQVPTNIIALLTALYLVRQPDWLTNKYY